MSDQTEAKTNGTSPAGSIAYAVWIRGRGWLRDDGGNVFADLHLEMAQGAAELWGSGARVVPFDDSMLNLEKVFLAHEHESRLISRLKWWFS